MITRTPHQEPAIDPPALRAEWLARVKKDADQSVRADLESTQAAFDEILSAAALRGVPSLSVVAADEPAFHFAWPTPGRVRVIETTLKRGSVFRTRYDVSLGERQASGEFSIQLHDFKLLEVDGMAATGPRFEAMAEELERVAATIPSFFVGANAGVTKLGDSSAMLAEFEELGMSMTEERLAAMLPLLAKFWLAWSEAWEGLGLEPDVGFSTTPVDLRLHGNERFRAEAHGTRRRLPDNLWRLTLAAESPHLEHEPFPSVLREALEIPFSAEHSKVLAALSVKLELEALLDTEASLPLFVARNLSVKHSALGVTDREVQCWEFDWGDA